MYDCYDCQVNKFTALNTRQQGPQPAQSPTTLTAGAAASDAGADAGSGRADGAAVAMARAQPSTLQVDVDFDMPRPAKLLRSGHNHQHLRETLELDPPGAQRCDVAQAVPPGCCGVALALCAICHALML